MKKLFTLLVLTLGLMTVPTFAQQHDNVQVDITKLSQEQLRVWQELKKQQAESNSRVTLDTLTPDKVDRYAQMGKGLGIAINEGLGAVTKNVEQFSQTSAGKWLMVLITWKVMGDDAVGLVRSSIQWCTGGLLLLVGIPFWIWIVKRNCVNRPIAAVEKIGVWTKKIVYTDRNPIHEDMTVVYGLCFLVYLAAVALITFIH